MPSTIFVATNIGVSYTAADNLNIKYIIYFERILLLAESGKRETLFY